MPVIKLIRTVVVSAAVLTFGAMAFSGEAVAAGPAETTESHKSPAEDETERLNAWLDAKYEEQLGFSPMARAYNGD